MHPVTAHSQGANPPRRCLCLYLYCNLSPARCSRVVRALFVRVRTRCSYEFARCSYAVRTLFASLFVRCSYERTRARTHPRTTRRAPLGALPHSPLPVAGRRAVLRFRQYANIQLGDFGFEGSGGLRARCRKTEGTERYPSPFSLLSCSCSSSSSSSISSSFSYLAQPLS